VIVTGSACEDVRQQMAQIARGDTPSSRSTSLPAARPEDHVRSAEKAVARMQVSGGSDESDPESSPGTHSPSSPATHSPRNHHSGPIYSPSRSATHGGHAVDLSSRVHGSRGGSESISADDMLKMRETLGMSSASSTPGALLRGSGGGGPHATTHHTTTAPKVAKKRLSMRRHSKLPADPLQLGAHGREGSRSGSSSAATAGHSEVQLEPSSQENCVLM
jgi:hypothetical protein